MEKEDRISKIDKKTEDFIEELFGNRKFRRYIIETRRFLHIPIPATFGFPTFELCIKWKKARVFLAFSIQFDGNFAR